MDPGACKLMINQAAAGFKRDRSKTKTEAIFNLGYSQNLWITLWAATAVSSSKRRRDA